MRIVEGRHELRRPLQGLTRAPGNREIVNQSQVVQAGRDLLELLVTEPALQHLVAGQSHTDDEVAADVLAHLLKDFNGDGHAIHQVAAVLIGPKIAAWRPELLLKVRTPVGEVNAITTGLQTAHGRGAIRVDELADVLLGHHVSNLVMHFLGLIRRGVDRRTSQLGAAASPAMADLGDQQGAVLVRRLRKLLVPGDYRVIPIMDPTPVRRERAGMDAGGAEGLDYANTALRLVRVIVEIALGGIAVSAISSGVRR